MEAQAILRSARLSPRKTRQIVDMVRGKGVQNALNILTFSPRPSARIVATLLKSAVANAEQKGLSDVDSLYVKSIFVDGGTVLKRFLPRAQGRASKIRKPTSHITIVVADKR